MSSEIGTERWPLQLRWWSNRNENPLTENKNRTKNKKKNNNGHSESVQRLFSRRNLIDWRAVLRKAGVDLMRGLEERNVGVDGNFRPLRGGTGGHLFLLLLISSLAN